MLAGGDDEAAHQARIAEAHLGLGRMHVHVDLLGRQLDEERHQGMAVAREEVLIGAADGAVEQLVAHRTAVHEEILVLRVAAVERRQAGAPRPPAGGRPQGARLPALPRRRLGRSEEHTSELQSLMRISYAVFCLKKKKIITYIIMNILPVIST